MKLFATLTQFLPAETVEKLRDGNPLIIDVPAGTTVAGILERLGLPPEHTKLVFVNGRQQGLECVLQDGDQLGLFPPIAGG